MSNPTPIELKKDPKLQPYRPRQIKIEITLDCGPYYRRAQVDPGGKEPPVTPDPPAQDLGYGMQHKA